MSSAMVLPIQDQRLRDLRRGMRCSRCWGGVEELGESGHRGGRGSGFGGMVLVLAKGVTRACD